MRKFLLIILLISATTTSLLSQEMAVPVGVQHTLLMKVLAFDRALQARCGDEIIIGVLYQSKYRPSLLAKDELMSIAEASMQKINNIVVRWRPIDISETGDLRASLTKHHVDILYVAPVRSVDIDVITSVCRASHILTLTGVSEFVEAGLAVGIGIKGKRPQIEINLAAAKAVGADFTSQLLKVAKIVE
jgi:hypothetical protein